MKNKLLYMMLLLFGTMWACNDEPEFPDPGLDATRSSIDTVRRDTIDRYVISMDISAPNGVESIQVLNGRNYEIIDEFTEEYRGMTEFTFDYTVDLTEIVVDTTLQYIVKVIDQNMRSYNKGFTLYVRKFSSPEISIVGEAEVLGLVSSVFQLKALFETGLNTIASYRVLFEGEVIDEQSFPDTLMHEYQYSQVISVDMEEGREYTLAIELTDNEGTVGRKEMGVRLIEMTRPTSITVVTESGTNRTMELFYDEGNDRLDSMLITIYSQVLVDGYLQDWERHYRYDFQYTDEGMVSSWVYTNVDEGEESSNRVYTYIDGTRVKTVDREEGSSNALDVQEWYDHGGVKSYYVGTNAILVDDIHYTPEIDGEGMVFSEYVTSSNRTNTQYRQHAEDMTAVLIPTYFPELPPLMLGSPDNIWQDLFMYKYVFAVTKYTYQEGNEETSWVTYTTDTNGRLLTLRRTEEGIYGIEYNEYQFSYE